MATRVQGSGFRVQGSGFRVQGSGCGVDQGDVGVWLGLGLTREGDPISYEATPSLSFRPGIFPGRVWG